MNIFIPLAMTLGPVSECTDVDGIECNILLLHKPAEIVFSSLTPEITLPSLCCGSGGIWPWGISFIGTLNITLRGTNTVRKTNAYVLEDLTARPVRKLTLERTENSPIYWQTIWLTAGPVNWLVEYLCNCSWVRTPIFDSCAIAAAFCKIFIVDMCLVITSVIYTRMSYITSMLKPTNEAISQRMNEETDEQK